MSSMVVTELRRVGANVLEETPLKFEWNSQNHSMIQDTLDIELQVNTSREMPAGAEEPIEHVASVEYGPVEMHGEWKDQWAGQGFAERTMIEFSRMCGRVPLVRVTLGKHSLVGLITKFRIKWRTDFEIGYGFTLSVHRNELIGSFRVTPIVEQLAVDFDQRILSQFDFVDQLASATDLVKELPFSTEDLEDSMANLGDLTTTVNNAKFTVDAVAFGDEDTTFSASNVVQGSLLTASEMIDHAQHKLLAVAAAFSGIRGQAQASLLDVDELISSDVLAYDDVLATLRFEQWVRTQHTECVKMIGEARDGERDARARASRRPRGIHRVKSGDTLDRISTKWYGNPDSSRLIRDANNLDSLILPVGKDLVIPDVSR